MDQELSAYRGVTFDFPGVTLERLEPWKANVRCTYSCMHLIYDSILQVIRRGHTTGTGQSSLCIRTYALQILVKGKMVFLGSYETEEDAAHAFDRAALTVAGYGATLNYPLALYTAELPELLGQSTFYNGYNACCCLVSRQQEDFPHCAATV